MSIASKKTVSLVRTMKHKGNTSGSGSLNAAVIFWPMGECSKEISLQTCFVLTVSPLLTPTTADRILGQTHL